MEKKLSELFVFDLDGTLVHDSPSGERHIPTDLLEALRELAMRFHILVATGRRYRSAQPVLEVLPAMEFSICHNGLVIRNGSGEIVFKRNIPWKRAQNIFDLLKGKGTEPIFVLDGEVDQIDFAFQESSLHCSAGVQALQKRSPKHILRFVREDGLSDKLTAGLIEVACIAPYPALLQLKEKILDRLPADLRAIVVKKCGTPGFSVMEIFDKRSSKWSGIEYVRNLLGTQRVIAVGDDENDLEMIKFADIGLVMDHAEIHIRAHGQGLLSGPTGLANYLRGTWLK